MGPCEELRPIVEDLAQAVHQQAKELVRFADRVPQLTGHLGYTPEFGVVAAELSELLVRLRKSAVPAP